MKLNNKLIDFTKSTFDKLNNKKIEYCFLRNYQKLWDETGFDIDLLINESQKLSTQKIIKNLALKYELFFSIINKKESIKIFVCDYDISNNKKNWIYFDIQLSINCFNRFKFYFNDITIDYYSIDTALLKHAYTHLDFNKHARQYGKFGGYAHLKTLIDLGSLILNN